MAFDKKAWSKAYYRKNKARMNEYRERWKKEHPEEWKAIKQRSRKKNAAKNREIANRWAKNNSEYTRHNASIQNARRKGAPGSHTLQEWNELKRRCNYTCQRCGRKEPEIKLTKDHIIPISKGGTSDISNIQSLCKTCNCSKREFIE